MWALSAEFQVHAPPQYVANVAILSLWGSVSPTPIREESDLLSMNRKSVWIIYFKDIWK